DRRQGDKETGDKETRRWWFRPVVAYSMSRRLLVSLSPCLLSPCLLVSFSLSPCLPVSLSPCLLVSLIQPAESNSAQDTPCLRNAKSSFLRGQHHGFTCQASARREG